MPASALPRAPRARRASADTRSRRTRARGAPRRAPRSRAPGCGAWLRIVLQPIEHHPAVHVGQPQIERDRVRAQAVRASSRPCAPVVATTPRKPRSRARPSSVAPKVSSSSIDQAARGRRAESRAGRRQTSGRGRSGGAVARALGAPARRRRHRRRPSSLASACGRPGRRHVFRGQVQRERAAHAELALQVQLAAEQAGDLAADRQAEPGAAVLAAGAAVGLLERLEDDPLLVRGDADAGVGDREARSPVRRVQRRVVDAPLGLGRPRRRAA